MHHRVDYIGVFYINDLDHEHITAERDKSIHFFNPLCGPCH